MLIRVNVKQNAPVANSAAHSPIRSFEKFDVAAKGIGAHLLEDGIDVLNVGSGRGAEVTRGGLSEYQAPCHVSIGRGERCLRAQEPAGLRLWRNVLGMSQSRRDSR